MRDAQLALASLSALTGPARHDAARVLAELAEAYDPRRRRAGLQRVARGQPGRYISAELQAPTSPLPARDLAYWFA